MSERTLAVVEKEIESHKRQIELLTLEKRVLCLEELKSEYGDILDLLKDIPSENLSSVEEAIKNAKEKANKDNEPQQQVLSNVGTVIVEPVKKRRGRPRKNPIETSTDNMEEQPRRKRGRPRKNPEEQSAIEKSSQETAKENMTPRELKRQENRERRVNGSIEMSDVLGKIN